MDAEPAPDAPIRGRPLRIGFAGTPEFAARILEALLQGGWRPAVVYSQPDRPSGRGRKLQAPPVKALAVARGLPVRQPATLRSRAQVEILEASRLDVLVVAAYGMLLPPDILQVPRLGCINVHASLLPRWRGAAPIERAIMAGDRETGVCIMQMDEGLDTGPVYQCRSCPIGPDTDAPALEADLAVVGAELLLDCLARLPDLTPKPQPSAGATYARKLTRADTHIQWRRPAIEIERQVRALCGRMPAYTELGAVRMNVLAAQAREGSNAAAPGTIVAADAAGIQVACGSGTLSIRRLKLNLGKGLSLSAAEALRGYGRHLAAGTVLGPAGAGTPGTA